jgi:tetratricopeptide (TPR) repeat protein
VLRTALEVVVAVKANENREPTQSYAVTQPHEQPSGNGPAPRAEPAPTIGRFRVERLLGEGGFARVYLAYDPSLDRQVAIKVPHEDADRSAFLHREALVAAKLKHPAIVQIYEICPNSASAPEQASSPAYVVMQYVEGANLAERLQAGNLTFDRAVDLLLTVTEAVAFAHGKGVLHRDLKPQNILLDGNDRPYVADFGLAIREETVLHHVGERCGTPAYVSPEQAGGRPLTATSDVWSLGVILYELLARRRPFGSHPLEILSRLGKEEPVPPRELDSAVPQDLDRICLKCLAVDPAARYQSAAELAADLRGWQQQRGVGPSEDEVQRAEQYCKQGFSHLHGGDPASALDRFRGAVQLNPDSANAHYLLGLAYLMTDQQVRLAVDALRKSVELDRDNGPANFVLAHAYHELKADALASTFADQAVATQPANHAYREFQKQVRANLGSSSGASGKHAPAAEVDFSLDPGRRRRLGEVAEAVFRLERTRYLTLTHWTERYFPWRLLRRRPLLGSVVVALLLYGIALALQLPAVDAAAALRYAVPYAIVALALCWPFALTRLMEQLYVRLLPAVNMPEDAFRRFFVRQSVFVLGGVGSTDGAPGRGGGQPSWQYHPLHWPVTALWVSLGFCLQFPLAFAMDAPTPLTRAALCLTAAVQVAAFTWAGSMVVLSAFFAPRFYGVPVRYFLGMPAEMSLAAVGRFYVRVSWLACLLWLLFLAQHYVLRTYQLWPFVSVLYVAIGFLFTVSLTVVTQYQLHRLLTRLKTRRILEYSYHVEAAFERVMKKPGEKAFEELRAHQQFMKDLQRLPTRGLARDDLQQFLLIVAIFLGSTVLYAYLIVNGLWLL